MTDQIVGRMTDRKKPTTMEQEATRYLALIEKARAAWMISWSSRQRARAALSARELGKAEA